MTTHDMPLIRGLVQSMLTPTRDKAPPRRFPVAQAQSRWIDYTDGQLHVVVAGQGPAVLLVHGWGGRAEDLGAAAAWLVERGHQLIAVELPGHGEASCRRTASQAAARSLRTLPMHFGPLRAVVAHSLGAAIAVEAMAMGLPVERAVLIGAPTRILAHTRALAEGFGLTPTQVDGMVDEFLRLGIDLGGLAISQDPGPLRQPALFVHAGDDARARLADAVAGAAAWPGARLLRVDGLGHRRVLDDAQVLDAMHAFIAMQPSADPAVMARVTAWKASHGERS
mgnify:FL=1